MANIIPEKYHPRNAIKKRTVGALSLYNFRDGSTLLLRQNAEDKIFPQDKRTRLRKTDELTAKSGGRAAIYSSPRTKAVARRLSVERAKKLSRGKLVYTTAESFLRNYRRLMIARVRFESPMAWLTQRKKGSPTAHTIVTRQNVGRSRLSMFGEMDVRSEDMKKALYELGKMHGAGIRHGHPHINNIFVDVQGHAALVDPKHVEAFGSKKPRPVVSTVSLDEVRIIFPNAPQHKDALLDLAWLMRPIISLDEYVETAPIINAYYSGVEEGRERLEAFKRKTREEKK